MSKKHFYDLHICGNNLKNDLEMINESIRLGFTDLSLVYSPEQYNDFLNYKNDILSNFEDSDCSIYFSIKLYTKNPNDIQKYSQKFKNKTSLFTVVGGNDKINRLVCENRQVDILSSPYNRYNCGINHVLAKLAYENNITIELCLNDILSSFLSVRSKIIGSFKEIIQLYRKFNFPLIVSSKSSNIFDLRNPIDEIAIFKSIGLNDEEIEDIFFNTPKELLKFSKEKKNIPVLGVKEIKLDEVDL
ncbi:MAG: ribonuclease P subunit P30 [Methanobrevibacter sp.]|jgi:ribonuclease P/MRP protein subunit RPP1|nr:ribonuclease P subunit P30 [Candidatus Methanoflexus mossambicus]